jgi:hypothetical protein
MEEKTSGQVSHSDSATTDLTLTQVIESARAIKKEFVDPRISFYKSYIAAPRILFRTAGVATILLSATLPALALANFRGKEWALSIVSIAVAALTGLSSFYRWERMWRGYSSASVSLEQFVAKWELELTNARLILGPHERVKHVYQATNDLLSGTSAVVSSESEGFFSALAFPNQNSAQTPTDQGK